LGLVDMNLWLLEKDLANEIFKVWRKIKVRINEMEGWIHC
jgi:hypothetical protein